MYLHRQRSVICPRSTSPTVILAHGVGMWPGLFDPVIGAIANHGDWGCRVWHRPGYDGRDAVASLGEQTQRLADLINDRAPAVVVGVSGGATLALACAIDGVAGLAGLVTHEPLIGALEHELDARVRGAADELFRWPSRSGAHDFLLGLYGEASWKTMPTTAQTWADDHYAVVCAEVRQFALFQPALAQLQNIAVPHVTTVGQNSGPERHRVASLLGHAGASVRVIEGSGHLVAVDRPTSFAAQVNDLLQEVAL